MRKTFYPLLFILIYSAACAQVNLNDSVVKASIINIDLGIGIPQGDLANRFGMHGLVGGGYEFKSKKNVIAGFNGHYIFGSSVIEDSLFYNLKNENGFIIGTDGLLYNPILFEQGFDFNFHIGKITTLFSVNPNSGLTFLAGAGFLQHSIFILVDEKVVPQLSNEYKKGYDRLTNGFMLSQYIGYYMFSNKHFVNFRAGIELMEGFTKERRSFNFDTRQANEENRFDMLITLKGSWNLPIFEKPKRKFYY